MSVIRRWDKSKPPSGSFALNRDCPQAQGLVAWWPMGGPSGAKLVFDHLGKAHLSGTTGVMTLGRHGSPALTLNGTSHSLSGSAPIGSGDRSLHVFASSPSIATTQGLIALGHSSNAYQERASLILVGSKLWANIQSGATFYYPAQGATTLSSNREYGLGGRWVGDASRKCFVDGVEDGSNTTSTTPLDSDQIQLGRRATISDTQYFGGVLLEAVLWNIAVSDDVFRRINDPSTRFELWYPLRSRKWFTQGAAGAQTVAITQVSETDTAQALTAVAGARTVAIGQVSSTETAQALTVAATRVVALGQVASTETAQSLTATTTVTTAITAAQETDTAQSITSAAGTTTAISQVASTETAQAVTATNASTVAITQVQSTDTAQALTAAATKTQAITQAASTETAQAFTAVQPGVFTAVNESDAAQALSVVSTRTVSIGQVSAVETAQALTPVLTTTTGITLALEIDAAQVLAGIADQSVAVTQAQETDTARALTVFFEGGALDTVALYSIVTQLVSLSSKQSRTRSGDSFIAPVVSRDSHLGD